MIGLHADAHAAELTAWWMWVYTEVRSVLLSGSQPGPLQRPRLCVAAPDQQTTDDSADLGAIEAGEAGGDRLLFAGGLVGGLPLRLPGEPLLVLDPGLAEGLRHLRPRRLLLRLVPLQLVVSQRLTQQRRDQQVQWHVFIS